MRLIKEEQESSEKLLELLVSSTHSPKGRFSKENSYIILKRKMETTKNGNTVKLVLPFPHFLWMLGTKPVSTKEKAVLHEPQTEQENINRNNKHTKAKYENHIKSYIGHLDIFTIEHKKIEEIQKVKQKTHSPKTVNTITQLIGTIFNYGLKKENLILINPIKKVSLLSVNNERDKFLNLEEIKILLDKVFQDIELNLFTRLSLSTGGWVSTILNIKKKDIDLKNHTINLYDFKNQCSYIGFITDDLIPIMKDLIPTLKINDLLFK